MNEKYPLGYNGEAVCARVCNRQPACVAVNVEPVFDGVHCHLYKEDCQEWDDDMSDIQSIAIEGKLQVMLLLILILKRIWQKWLDNVSRTDWTTTICGHYVFLTKFVTSTEKQGNDSLLVRAAD